MRVESHKNKAQLVDEQVQQWLLTVRDKKERAKAEKQEISKPVLAISRQRGSGGWMIGKRIAEILDYDFFDSTILDFIAKDLKMTKKIIKSHDEQVITRAEVWINRIFRNRFIEPDTFQKQLNQTVLSIATHGRAVTIGRGTHIIIPMDNCFRIRFVAPFEHRVQTVASSLRFTSQEARYNVMKLDREREGFLRKTFDFDVTDPNNFDAIINTSGYTCETITSFIIEGYNKRFSIETDEDEE